MRQTLTVLDDFFPDPLTVRNLALSSEFSLGNEMDGHHYPDTAKPKHEGFVPWFEILLSNALGAKVQVNLCAFVIGKETTKTEQWIHADSNCAKWASVSYLFDGHEDHGTSFYTHRASGCPRMDQKFYDALKVDVTDERQVESLVGRIKAEGEDAQFWRTTAFTEARLGRTIWFDSKAFHSRSHRFAFGDAPENGRLILVSFFDVV